ncbi:MAG: hypothetical protein WKF29_02015 [Thermoleophilaceae bacterium]
MSTPEGFEGVDVDEATVEVIRANDAEVKRLSSELAKGGTDAEQVRLAAELVNASRRQEGVLSEVPGLETRGRALGETRAELERSYDL